MRRESLSKGIRVSEATINAWLELKFGRIQEDENLMNYLIILKAHIEATENGNGCRYII